MANFPTSPISGQVFTSSDLTNWVWDGSSWKVTNYGLIKLPVSQNSGSVIQSNTINFINTSTVTVNVDQSDANTANVAFNVILGDLLHAQEDEIIFSGPVTTTGSPNLTYNLASNTMRVGGDLFVANVSTDNVSVNGNITFTNARVSIANVLNVGTLFTANSANGNINVGASNVYITSGNLYFGTLMDANNANGNVAITGNLSVTRTFNVGSLISANTGNGNINVATSNVYIAGGNVLIGTLFNANVANGNLTITGNLSTTTTFNVGSLLTANTGNGNINIATSNVYIAGGNLYVGTLINSNTANGNVAITGNLSATRTFNVGSLLTANTGNGNINIATSNVHIAGGNLYIGTFLSSNSANANVNVTGNIYSSNLYVGSLVAANSANANVAISGNLIITKNFTSADLTATGNLYVGTLLVANDANGNVVITGNLSATRTFNVGSLLTANTGNGNINIATSNVYIAGGNVHIGSLFNANVANGNVAITGNLSATRTFNVGSLLTANTGNTNVNIATGNVHIAGGNLYIGTLFNANTANGNVSVVGNVLSTNVTASTLLNVGSLFIANTTNGNINVATSNVYVAGGNVHFGTLLNANVANANLAITGNLSVTRTFNVGSHFTANSGNTNVNIATGNVYIAGGNLYIGTLFNANTANGNVSIAGNVLSVNVTATTLLNVADLFTANVANDNINIGTGNVYTTGPNFNVSSGNLFIGSIFVANTANANVGVTGNLSVTRTFNVSSHLTANAGNTNINIATGNVHIAGGNLYIGNLFNANTANGNVSVVGNVLSTNVTASTLLNVGSLFIANTTNGNINVATSNVHIAGGNVHIGTLFNANVANANLAITGNLSVTRTFNVGSHLTANSVNTNINIATGNVHIAGGNLYISTYLTANSANANLHVVGNVYTVGNVYATSNVYSERFTDITSSTYYIEPSSVALSAVLAGNAHFGKAEGDSHVKVGTSAGGGYTAYFGASQTDATFPSGIKYGAYFAYDSYWDGTNWNADRTTLGRKWLVEMGYHTGQFKVRYFDGTVSSPWADSAWSDYLVVDRVAGNVGISTASPTSKLYVSGNATITSGLHIGAVDILPTLNVAANTVKVAANGGSILAEQEINFINTASIQVSVAAGAGAAAGNANVSFNANGTFELVGSSTTARTRISSPRGGAYAGVSGTGALQIKLPVYYNSTMMSILVHVYDYATGTGIGASSGKSFTIKLGGYNYSVTPNWINCFAYQDSMKGIGPKTVRFGDDGTNTTIVIGELTDSWTSSPHVFVEYMDLAYTGAEDSTWATTPLVISRVTSLPSNTKVTRVCSSGMGEVYANGGSQQNTTGLNFVNSSSILVSVYEGAGTAVGNANISLSIIESGTSVPDIKSALATHNTTFGTLNTTSATTNTTFGTLNTTSATTNTTFGTLNTTFATTNTTFGTINTNISNANTYASTLANAAANTVRVYANGGSIVNDSYLNFSNSYTTLVTVAAGAGATFSGNANVEFQSNSTFDLVGSSSASGIRITSPKGGTFIASTSPTTGAIQIKLPTFYNYTMLNMLVHVYDYGTGSGISGSSGKAFTIKLGGYNNDSGTGARYNWQNCYAYQQSMKGIGPKSVRFGDDGTNSTITIGETTDTYSFSPHVYVEYLDLGFTGATAAVWKSPLEITQVTSLVSNTKVTRVCSSGIGEVYANGGSQQNTTGFNFVNSSSILVSVYEGAGTAAGNANISFSLIEGGTNIGAVAALANAAANTVSVSANSGVQLTKKNLVFNNTTTIGVVVQAGADAANANVSFNTRPPVSGDWWNGGVPVVATDGVMEIGKFIDFHDTDAGTSDYSVRLTAGATGEYLQSSGELRANVFRDSDDLTYFVDPASKSNISSMNVWPGVTGPNTGIVINLGDITAGRTDQQGAIYLGRSGNTYLYFDGTRYRFGEAANIAPVYIPSGNLGLAISTPTSNLHVTGNANIVTNVWTSNVYAKGWIGINTTVPSSNLHITGNANITTNIYTGNVFTSNSLSVNTTAGRANVHFSNTTIIDTPVQSISVANFSANENCAGKILVCNNATTANPVNITFDVSATSGFAITLLRHGTGNTVIANTTALKKSNSSFFATSNIANRFCTATVIYTATNEIVVVGDIL